MMEPELQSKFATWRQRATAGLLTTEEMKEAILALRGSRRAAAESSKASTKSRTKAPARSADDMLGELEGL